MAQRTSRVAWILCLLLATAFAPVAAQDWAGRGRVRGNVKDEAGNAIEGAKVTLRYDRAPETGPEPILTDDKGIWGFMGLASGAWRVADTFSGPLATDAQILSGALKHCQC